jgi:hypothetical protein
MDNALIAGGTDEEVASQVGCHRTTVSRWKLHHPRFRAVLNERRQEAWGASLDRLRALLPSALDRLEEEITKDGGAWQAAVKLLEIAGAGGMAPVSPDVPTTAKGVIDADIGHRWGSILRGVVASGGLATAAGRTWTSGAIG